MINQGIETKVRSEYTDERKRMMAMTRAISLGFTISQDHPEIKELYEQGYSYSEINESKFIEEKYEVPYRTAIGAIGYAIRGFKGNKHVKKFSGLIKDENERKRLEKEHKIKGAFKSKEKAAEKRGQVPWIIGKNDLDVIYLITLVDITAYSPFCGSGYKNWDLISKEVNKKLYGGKNIRTPESCKKTYYRYRNRIN